MDFSSEKIKHLKKGIVEKTTYDNGAVFIHHKTPHLNASSLCVWFMVGSRNETQENQGICHLIEHMMFRGKFSSPEKGFVGKLEEAGADVNAFTTKETICFELSALGKRIPDIFENFMELVFSPTFDEAELEKEKKIVVQEIREDNDDHDLVAEEKSFEKSFSFPLGHSIAGTCQTVRSLTVKDLKKFYRKYLIPSRMVVTLVGDMSSLQYKRKLAKLFEQFGMEKTGTPFRPKLKSRLGNIERFNATLKRGAEVSSVVMSGIGACFDSDFRADMVLLNNYLSEGMSSLLFRSLREDEGLAYSLSSYPNFFTDNGSLILSVATQKKNVEKVYEKILQSFELIHKEGIPDKMLSQLKRQILDSWELSLDDVDEVNAYLSKVELYRGQMIKAKILEGNVERISPTRLKFLAEKILQHGFSSVKVLAK